MKLPPMKKIAIPAAILLAGLIIGLGIGQVLVRKEQTVCQDRLKEKDRKIAFIQRKTAEEKAEATGSLEQRWRDDAAKLQAALQAEKKKAGTLGSQVAALSDQSHKLEARIKTADEAMARTRQDLQEAQRSNKDLDKELKKTVGEKQNLQADLKKTNRELGTCTTNNSALAGIAEELVTKYKSKGFGSVLLEKEPLTQVKKVELEQLTSQYQEEIENKKLTKK